MIDFRPILFVIGILLTTLAVAMGAPMIADLVTGHPDWRVFATSAGLTLFIGGILILTNRTQIHQISIRQAFVLTTLSWLVMTTFAALPMAYSDIGLSYTDAFFEAMSGVTTTGSTVISGLDDAPRGLLLWRALLQWLGGIGIIVMAVAIMPMLKIGGMQLFRMESSDTSAKAMPRVAQIASGIGIIYLLLTAILVALLWVSGMNGFDAFAHAMTTIATGGFSTRDASIGYFQNPTAEMLIVLFMVIGSLPFVLYLQAARGNPGQLLRDSQVRWFLALAVSAVAVVAVWHAWENEVGALQSLRLSVFNVMSILTGTGFTSADYGSWGGFATAVFFFVMFIGGCAGSTTCGIKVFRFQVLHATAKAQIHQLMQPHGVFVPHYNHRPIAPDVSQAVMGFFFLFAATFAALALMLGMLGLDFVTAISGAASAICNVGPALGDIIGPAGNFATLPDAAKWVLSAGMLLGRLELYTVLILFVPTFWRG
jgi:trk system potassium uptake protein TrkH